MLDIGCGIGRLALPLTSYLKGGSYDGWTSSRQGSIGATSTSGGDTRISTSRWPMSTTRSTTPKGACRHRNTRFPIPTTPLILLFLISVFTHMLPEDTHRYIAEISRRVRPGGRCWASFYIFDADSIEMMEAGKGFLRFKHDHGTYWTVNDKAPELSTGYEEGYVKELFERHGLSLADGMYYGGWSGRPPLLQRQSGNLGDQDILLATKLGSPPAA